MTFDDTIAVAWAADLQSPSPKLKPLLLAMPLALPGLLTRSRSRSRPISDAENRDAVSKGGRQP